MGKDEYETADAFAPSAYPDDYMLNLVNLSSKRARAANASATAVRRPHRLEDPPRQGRGVPAGLLSRTCARAFACARALIETAWRVACRNGSLYVFGPDCLFVSSAVAVASRFPSVARRGLIPGIRMSAKLKFCRILVPNGCKKCVGFGISLAFAYLSA